MDLYISLVKKEVAISKEGLTLEEAIKRVQEYTGYTSFPSHSICKLLVQELMAREEFQLENADQLLPFESSNGLQSSVQGKRKRSVPKSIKSLDDKGFSPQLACNCAPSCSEAVFLRICGFSELEQAQISSESFRILTIIAKYTHQGGISQNHLARLASVDPNTLHHHIRVLRNMRLINRRVEIRSSEDSNKHMKTYKVYLSAFRFRLDVTVVDEPVNGRNDWSQEDCNLKQENVLESCELTDPNTSDTELPFYHNVYLTSILRILFRNEGYVMALNSLKDEFMKEVADRSLEMEDYSTRKKALRLWRSAMNKLEERKLVEKFTGSASDENNSEIEYVHLRMFEEDEKDSQDCKDVYYGVQNRLLWERTLEFQVLSLILESGERGISQREIYTELGCKASRKVISAFCKGLMTNLGFKAKSIQEGKQAIYYYVAPEYLRNVDLNNPVFLEVKDFIENSQGCSNTQQVTNLQSELRTKNLLDCIRQEKVLNLSDLGHLLAAWEQASFSRVDKKTVERLVKRLEEAGQIKTLSVNMPYILERNSPQQIKLVTLPEIDEDSYEIEEFIRKWNGSSCWKMTKNITKEGSDSNAKAELVCLSSSDQKTNMYKQDSSRNLGNMLHGRRLHLHLFHYFLKNQQQSAESSKVIPIDVAVKNMRAVEFLELFGDSSCSRWVPLDALQLPLNELPENITTKLYRSRPVNRKLSLLVDLLEQLFLLSRVDHFQCTLVTEIIVCGWDNTNVKFTFDAMTEVDKFWFHLQRNCLLFASKTEGGLLQHQQALNTESGIFLLCLHNLFPGAFSRKQWCDKIWKLSKESRSSLCDSLKALLRDQGSFSHESLMELSKNFDLDVCEVFTEAVREASASNDRMRSCIHDSNGSKPVDGQSSRRKDRQLIASRRKRRLSRENANTEVPSHGKVVAQDSKESSGQRRRQMKKSMRVSWTSSQDKELIIQVFNQKVSEIEKFPGNVDIHSVLQAKVKSWDIVASRVGYSGQACKRRFLSLYRCFPYNEIVYQICQRVVDCWKNNNLKEFCTKTVLENMPPLEKLSDVGPKDVEDIPDCVEELFNRYDIEYLPGTSRMKVGVEGKQEQYCFHSSCCDSPKMVAIEELIKLVLREPEDTYDPERGMSILQRFTEEELKLALEDLRQRGAVVGQKADRHNREYSVSCKILKATSDNPFDESFHEDFSRERSALMENAFSEKDIVIDKDHQRSGSIAAILSLASTDNFLLRPNVDKTYFDTIKAKGLSKSVGSGGIGFHLKQYANKTGIAPVPAREDIPYWTVDLVPIDISERFLSSNYSDEEQLPNPSCSLSMDANDNDEYSLSVVASYSGVNVEEIEILIEEMNRCEENGMTANEMLQLHRNWTRMQLDQVVQGLVHFRKVYVSFIHGDEVRYLSHKFAQRFLLCNVSNTEQKIPFPWTNLAGETDTKSLMALEYWILYVVTTHPGIEENHLWSILREAEVPLASIRTIIEMFENDSRISKMQRFVDNDAGCITYYVPEQNCMGSLTMPKINEV